jgi:hypothetical protein
MNRQIVMAAAVAALGAGLATSSRAGAQVVNNNTTIPIIVVTLFTPGTVAVPVDPAVATAVVTTSERILRDRQVISPITGVAIPPEIVTVVVAMMTTATPEVRTQVQNALSQSGASGAVIRQLMQNLPSLLSRSTAGQQQAALSAFNGLVNNSSAAFLVNPPAEFLAIHAILLLISDAANSVPHP